MFLTVYLVFYFAEFRISRQKVRSSERYAKKRGEAPQTKARAATHEL